MASLSLAALGFWHESNSFSPRQASYPDFVIEREDEIESAHGGGRTSMAGFLAVRSHDVSVTPLLFAHVTPMGTVMRDAWERLFAELRARLLTRRWDGVLLALHGAAVGGGCRDLDGHLISMVRAAVGPDIPIGVALDMHANLSPEMVAGSTILTVYRTNPHLDAAERAHACATHVVSAARHEVEPVQRLVQIPIALGILDHGTEAAPLEPLLSVVKCLNRSHPKILNVDLAVGYPYADVEEMGMAAVVSTDNDPALASEVATQLAQSVWAGRGTSRSDLVTIPEALRRAHDGTGTSVILDVGDNVGAGAPGDSVAILRVAHELAIPGIVQTVCDPASAAQCAEAGEGGRLQLAVGGWSLAASDPLVCHATVKRIGDGAFEDGRPTHGGFSVFDGGPTASIVTDSGDEIVLTSKPVIGSTLAQFHSVGVRPENASIVVAKGVFSPRPAFAEFASEFITADSPGVTTARLTSLAYQNRRRPLIPFETIDPTSPVSLS